MQVYKTWTIYFVSQYIILFPMKKGAKWASKQEEAYFGKLCHVTPTMVDVSVMRKKKRHRQHLFFYF